MTTPMPWTSAHRPHVYRHHWPDEPEAAPEPTPQRPSAPFAVEYRAGIWLVVDTRDGHVFADCGKTERGHAHALNLAREHNMEIRLAEREQQRVVNTLEEHIAQLQAEAPAWPAGSPWRCLFGHCSRDVATRFTVVGNLSQRQVSYAACAHHRNSIRMTIEDAIAREGGATSTTLVEEPIHVDT